MLLNRYGGSLKNALLDVYPKIGLEEKKLVSGTSRKFIDAKINLYKQKNSGTI